MIKLQVEIDLIEEQFADVALAIATRRGYTPTIIVNDEEQANPKTPADYLLEAIGRFFSDELIAFKASQQKVPETANTVTLSATRLG